MKKKEKNQTYAIIGLGRFGSALADELHELGVELLVIDRDPEKIRKYRNYTENAYVIEDINEASLRKVGIENCDVAVVCIADQIDASILITLDLVNIGVKHILARAKSANHGAVLNKLGAEVVYPERDMAIRVARRLENSKTLDYISLSEQVNITKLKITNKGANKNILDLKIREKFGCNIIAIETRGMVLDTVNPIYALKKGDIIYATGNSAQLAKLTNHV